MVDPELDELRREFLVEAQEKVGQMQTALDEGNGGREALEQLAYLAHQLKGSGGSYGYQTISTDAAEIEKAVEALEATALDAGLQDRIKRHVTNLRLEIDLRSRELGA